MKYPIGIQTFAEIRENDYVYVDKTALIYQLIQNGKYYLLSRPRRFGKSLLVSTLESYFSGQKELFKGLAIEKLETEWKQYPVLHLDLNSEKYKTEEDLDIILDDILTKWEAIYGSSLSEKSPSRRFSGIVQRAYEQTKEKVVILVDEYDKPLLQTIDRTEVQEAYRETLRGVYSVLKSQDRYIKFGLLTGVTKFSHVSIFSDLNNLNDISMLPQYVDICGISEKELHTYFDGSIHKLADANNMTFEETCKQLRTQYDGYHFYQDTMGIYNPFSLLSTFENKIFNDYWFATGTPTFLVKLLKNNNVKLSDLQGLRVSSMTLNPTDSTQSNFIPILYQSGYLTIKGYDPHRRRYILDYPNQEVERGFIDFLIPYYTPLKEVQRDRFVDKFEDCVIAGQPDDFMLLTQTMLASNDYRVAGDKELYFQNTIGLIFKMLSFVVDVEPATSFGRMDLVIKTKDYIYILELKLDGTAEAALQQIKDKQYARQFQLDPRKRYLIGVNFSSETRNIEKWIIE